MRTLIAVGKVGPAFDTTTSWLPLAAVVTPEAFPPSVPIDAWSGNPDTDKQAAHDARVFDSYFPGVTY